MSFGNKDGEYFIDHNNLDSWVYPNEFSDKITIDLTEQNPSGKADWLFLGTKDNDEVTFNIKSISFKLGAANLENVNTDGLTEAIKEEMCIRDRRQRVSVTATFGFVYCDEKQTMKERIALADSRLNQGKEKGKNQIVN